MKLTRLTPAVIGIVAVMLAAPASARADAAGDWNAIAVTAITTACPAPTCVPAIPARPGPTGVLDVAMVQAAVYDAVQAIERDFEPYYVEIPGASGSPVAAAAKAAHDVLVSRFPWQSASLDIDLQPVSDRPRQSGPERPWSGCGGNGRCGYHRLTG